MRLYLKVLCGLLRRALRSRQDLLMENLVLRQQLAVYARRSPRAELAERSSGVLVGGGSRVGPLGLVEYARQSA